MSDVLSSFLRLPGFSFRETPDQTFGIGQQAVPRSAGESPAMVEGVRAKMEEALYSKFYANALPREQFDRQTKGKSDAEIADATFNTFYKDKLDRADFNKRIGFTSASGSTIDALARGASLGFLDEAGAAGAALGQGAAALVRGRLPSSGDMSAAYNDTLRAQRENAEVFRQNNPYLGRALEFVGGAASGSPMIPSAPTLGQSALNAARIGAVAGFGEGEGGVESRLLSSGVGAAIGGGLGVGLPLAMQGTSLVLGKVGRALGLGNNERTATQMILKAFEDDGIPPAEIASRLQAWQAQGAKPEALFDVGGKNVQRLARTAAGRTGPGAEKAAIFLEGRQSDQAARVGGDVTATLGQSADDFFPRLDALKTARSTQARPRYEAAFSRITPTVEEATRVQSFIRDPIGQDALQRGMRVIEIEHLARKELFRPAMYGVTRGDDGRWMLEGDKVPNLRLMDAVKRGYDSIVESFRSPVTGRLALDDYGNAVNQARATYVRELRDMYPRYGSALDAWAGPSTLMDAANRGRNIYNMKDTDVAKLAASAKNNPGEAEAFRLGVTQAMRDQIERASDGSDAIKRIFGSPIKQKLIEAAFPSAREYHTFEMLMKREAEMFKNARYVNAGTGSQTQSRQADAQTFGDQVTGIIGDTALSAMLPGRSVGAALGQGARDILARGQGVTPGVADSLVSRMFSGDAAANMQTGGLLTAVQVQNALRNAEMQRLRGLLPQALTAGGVTAGF